RWLAGMALLDDVEPTAEWRAYAEKEDERWRTARVRIEAMRAWSAREIGTVSTLFYPFAGADALHALALFPTATRVARVGLEPLGTLPVPSRVPGGFFQRLGHASDDLHRLTFYRTQEMASDFARDGVLTAIVATIARLGGRIASVQVGDHSARVEWDG